MDEMQKIKENEDKMKLLLQEIDALPGKISVLILLAGCAMFLICTLIEFLINS